MLFKREWILTMGILAMTSSLTMAGEPRFKLFRNSKATQTSQSQERSPQVVANDIGKALSKAKLQGTDVEIEYIDGVATITGKVADSRQKAMAEHVAMMIPEVKSVQNQLALKGAAPASPSITQASFQNQGKPAPSIQQVSAAAADRDLNTAKAQEIASALKKSGISGYDMEIRYEDGVAGLHGVVASPEQRFLAEKAVTQVGGVLSVDNKLQVAGGPQAGPGAMPPQAGGLPPHMAMAMGSPGGMPPEMQRQMAMQAMMMQQRGGMPPMQSVSFQPQMNGAPPAPAPGPMAHAGPGPVNKVYNQPHLPNHSWPTYAAYPNYSQVSYPKQYSASAFPYIGPFYPYPQVPLGWRKSSLEWDDGHWQLKFDSKTDRWWWFMNPANWD